MFQEAKWLLRGLDQDLAWITSRGWSSYDAGFGAGTDLTHYWVNATAEATWLYDPYALELRGGTQAGQVLATLQLNGEDGETHAIDALVMLDRPDRMRIELDGHLYWLDLETAEVTVATQVD
jgi:hypothetical protein